MSDPVSVKDLPKVTSTLKRELELFNQRNMKHAATTEKIVLPSAEGN